MAIDDCIFTFQFVTYLKSVQWNLKIHPNVNRGTVDDYDNSGDDNNYNADGDDDYNNDDDNYNNTGNNDIDDVW